MKRIFRKSLAIFLAALLLVSSGIATSAEPADDSTATGPIDTSTVVPEGMEVMLENDKYEMFFNKNDGSAALKNKSTGYVWHTNPSDTSATASGNIDSRLKSQLFIYYYNKGVLTEMDTYSFGIALGNMPEFKTADNSVIIKYKLGKEKITNSMLPSAITKERMEEEILSKASDEDKEVILNYYRLYEHKKLSKDALEGLKLNYPTIDKDDLYVKTGIPPYKLKTVYECFKRAGYTLEDLKNDCAQTAMSYNYVPDPSFTVEIAYSLNDDGFSATIDPSKIEYNSTYPPVRVAVLPYFGAAGTDEEGYMFVPDGCGAIIEFNNGKISEDNYWKEFFGVDKVYDKQTADIASENSVLPVFAMSNSKSGYLATIESGYESAGVCADISGRMNNYNFAYSFFNLFNNELIALTGNANDKFMLYNQNILAAKICIDYHITDTSKTYSEFAVMYRDILNKKKVLPTDNKIDASVLDVNFLGVTTVSKRFLGVPYETTDTFTTFEQATKILNKLNGIKTDVNYISALKGGIKQTSADSIKFDSKLGNKKALNNLMKAANSLSVSFNAQSAAKVGKKDRVIGLNGGFVRNVRYDVISNKAEESMFYMVAPGKLESYADKVLKSLSKNDGLKLSIADVGYNLSSDFNDKADTDRSETRAYVQKYLKKLSEEEKLTAQIGAYYSLPYLSKITSIPTRASGYGIEDYTVPFYQIVVSGSLNYSVAPVNDTNSARAQFLKAVETGARLQYTWYYEKPDDITNSYENYFGFNYKSTIEQAKKYSKEYSSLAKKLSGSSIVKHTRLTEDLVKVEWSNGVTVYVNYGDTEASADNVTVKAQNFATVG